MNEYVGTQLQNYLVENKQLKPEERKALQQFVAVGLGAATGAVSGNKNDVFINSQVALNAEKFNRQLHPSEIMLIRENAKQFAKEQGISESEAKSILLSVALSQVDSHHQKTIVHTDKSEAAQLFLSNLGSGKAFTDEHGRTQFLFDERNNASNFNNHALNGEHVYPNKDSYNLVKDRSNNFTAEVLANIGGIGFKDYVTEPDKVKKAILDDTVSQITDSIEDATAISSIIQAQAGIDGEVNLGIVKAKGSVIDLSKVPDDMNEVRLKNHLQITRLKDALSSEYSVLESSNKLSKEERIKYQKQHSVLLSLEGLAAAGVTSLPLQALKIARGSKVAKTTGAIGKKEVPLSKIAEISRKYDIEIDPNIIKVLSISEAKKLGGKNKGLIFVKEPQGNFDKDYVKFESGTSGAMSDIKSKQRVVPALRYDNTNPNGHNFIKLDGFEINGNVLIDRKTNLTTFKKQIVTLQRMDKAIKQNPEYKVIYEFPNQKAADKASEILKRNRIDNIEVRIAQ